MSLINNVLPSDRMAVLWTLLTLKDAIVLEYGPMGTTCFARRFMGSLGLETAHLFSTHLSEDDVIMGDVTRLEKALIEIDKDYQPKVIFVVPSAILAVTGADTAGVCHYMQKQVKARLITYEGGFKGDYLKGLSEVYLLLVKEFAEMEAKSIAGTYNILGASVYDCPTRIDLQKMECLPDQAFDAKCLTILGLSDSVDDLKRLGQASINIVIREEALPAAKWLKENCSTEYVYAAHCEYSGNLDWLDICTVNLH